MYYEVEKYVILFLKTGGIAMTRLELLTMLLSLKALLETENNDKALELVNEVIAEAKRPESNKQTDKT